MSVKSEYDLGVFCGVSDETEENYFGIEQHQPSSSTDIDIKFELPYQSTQSSFQEQSGNKPEKDNLEELADPLRLDDEVDDESNNSILDYKLANNPKFLWAPVRPSKKLRTISTALCTKCNVGFPSPTLFEQHMIQIHQDDRPYPCTHCGKPFATITQQKCHETIHNPTRFQGEPQFTCDICNKAYHLKRSLATHKKKIHLGYKPPKRPKSTPVREHHSTNGSKNPNSYRKPKEIFKCPHCDLTFNMKCHVEKHLIVHTKERPFFCTICHESFPRKSTLDGHIKNMHHSSTTPKGRTQSRPKSQANQPCPCTICGKVYRTPSQLTKHFRIHSGEKPFSCKLCPRQFRVKGDLTYHVKQSHIKDQLVSNPLKLFKCRVCGKNDFLFFRDLRQHRIGVHKNIAYDSEKEKPFACGICGKPHFLREGAIICALLGHEPGQLRRDMFKIRCPECSEEEIFGFYNVLALRRHWDREHGDKKIPARFRQGMNGEKELKDELPNCRIDKVKKEFIQRSGSSVFLEGKREEDMYVELDLFEVPENERLYRRMKQKKVIKRKYVEQVCTICGVKLSSIACLKRHVRIVHDPSRKNLNKIDYECDVCGKVFQMAGYLRNHEKKCHSNKIGRRENAGVAKKIITDGMKTKNEKEIKVETNCDDNKYLLGLRSVNIKNQYAVKEILNFQSVNVRLTRLNV